LRVKLKHDEAAKMVKKKAVITAELVQESENEDNRKIVRELLEWFSEEAVTIPWVDKIKNITIEEN